MVYRFTWLAGIAAIGMALLRLNGLMRPTVEGAPWQLVVIAGVVLGAVVTWTSLAYRMNLLLVGALNVLLQLANIVGLFGISQFWPFLFGLLWYVVFCLAMFASLLFRQPGK